jgi:hypothetical protein
MSNGRRRIRRTGLSLQERGDRVGFELKGLDHLFPRMDKIPGAMSNAAIAGENKTLQDITTDAKENCPVDTGQLRESIQPYFDAHQAKDQGGVISGASGTNVEHGVYVELGTGPIGEETPVPDKYPGDVSYTQKGWTYFDEKTGQFVHTRGQPAQPYLYPAEQAHAGELPENIKKAAEKELRGIVI